MSKLFSGKTLGLLPLFACAIGCGGADSIGGSEDDVSTRTVVYTDGFIVGEFADDAEASEASWQRACEAWVDDIREQAPRAHVRGYDCGFPGDLAPGVMGSLATIQLALPVDAFPTTGTERGDTIIGAQTADIATAVREWKDSCKEEVQRAREIYGDRLVVATCARPENAHPSASQLVSRVQMVMLPPPAARVDVDGFLFSKASTDFSAALADWQRVCREWQAGHSSTVNGTVVRHDCGDPEQIALADGTIQFQSSTRIAVMSSKDATIAPTVFGGVRTNPASDPNSREAALRLWQSSCDAAIAQQRQLFGNRFVTGSCGRPSITDTAPFTVSSQVQYVTAPAGATKIPVSGYVVGARPTELTSAREQFDKAYAAWLGDLGQLVGTEHIEGHDSSAPMPLANDDPNSPLFATTIAYLGFDTAEGETIHPIEPSEPRVEGTFATTAEEAVASWQKACSTRITEVQARIGDSFVVGACGQPQVSFDGPAMRYDSYIDVWVRE